MKKPVKIQSDPYYNFLEVMHYLEEKHGKNFRDYAGKYGKTGVNSEAPYLDFWHWMMNAIGDSIQNGCFIYMPEYMYIITDVTEPDWVKEILGYFMEFLQEDYDKKMWLEW